MKKIFPALIVTLLASACVHDKEVFTGIDERLSYCEAFVDYDVPVKAGFTTIVTYEKDTLAVANEPMTIKVPKGSISPTRSGSSLNIDYDVLQDVPSYSHQFQAVMFEDSKDGDYDYNDLVLHVENTFTHEKGSVFQTVTIQPIALGGLKDIKLGCILADNSERMIAESVRGELFEGEEGFINTENDKESVRYKMRTIVDRYKVPKKSKTVAFFIEVEGKRLYAVTSDHKYADYDMFNKEGMPYGLVTGEARGRFEYAQERTPIYDVYDRFKDWINGSANNIGPCDKSLKYKDDSVWEPLD